MDESELEYIPGLEERVHPLPQQIAARLNLTWGNLLLVAIGAVGVGSLFFPSRFKFVWDALYSPVGGIFWLFGHPQAASYAVFLGLACLAVLLFPLTILLPLLEDPEHHEWWRLPVAILAYPVLLLAVLILWGVVRIF